MNFACMSVTELAVLSEIHSEFMSVRDVECFMSVRDVECFHECQGNRVRS
jgi:hypothetical protein